MHPFVSRAVRHLLPLACWASLAPAIAQTPPAASDPYLWLEEVDSARAMAWVKERNAQTQALVEAAPGFAQRREQLQAVLNSREEIPTISRMGEHVYNTWKDARNPRGLWRRTTLEQYRKADVPWDILLDLDALGKVEGVSWVWSGATCLAPLYRRCLLSLSRGGADAVVVREFDLTSRQFVEGGFQLPEAKSSVHWRDADTVWVATHFGPGSLTKSGYARVVKEWKRGTPLGDARELFAARETDVSVFADVDRTPGFERNVVGASPDFFTSEMYLLRGTQRIRLDKPADADLKWHRQWAFLQLRSSYTVGDKTYRAGSLLATPFEALVQGKPVYDVLFEPTATRSIARNGLRFTRDHVLLSVMDNVVGRVEELHHQDGHWIKRLVETPALGRLGVQSLHDAFVPDDPLAHHYLLNYADFLTPDSLYLGQAGSDVREPLKTRARLFDSTGMRTEQHFATSKDGTRIPYFVVWPRGAQADSKNPTILYGYGGFQVSQLPGYYAKYGAAWHNTGGVLVMANIRGGGEFGPAWHTAATKANKQRSYDDFAAVAEDVIARKITSSRHLGISGGSNGGLLVGAVMLQRPELFAAVLCSVPLLDMQRYHTLLAGNSWMAEYGNPDVAREWEWIRPYSPYHNVRPGVRYPKVLFTTSTRDDRVHPAHARKMAARMLEQGHEGVFYYENIEGGHGGAADNGQRAYLGALELSFLWQALGGDLRTPPQ